MFLHVFFFFFFKSPYKLGYCLLRLWDVLQVHLKIPTAIELFLKNSPAFSASLVIVWWVSLPHWTSTFLNRTCKASPLVRFLRWPGQRVTQVILHEWEYFVNTWGHERQQKKPLSSWRIPLQNPIHHCSAFSYHSSSELIASLVTQPFACSQKWASIAPLELQYLSFPLVLIISFSVHCFYPPYHFCLLLLSPFFHSSIQKYFLSYLNF